MSMPMPPKLKPRVAPQSSSSSLDGYSTKAATANAIPCSRTTLRRYATALKVDAVRIGYTDFYTSAQVSRLTLAIRSGGRWPRSRAAKVG